MDSSNLIFDIGVIMIVAFVGAVLAKKAKQSVILGYILAGILIGPYIALDIFGWKYDGLVQDTEFITTLSTFGLILLMFFVGLEFSFSKLKRTRSPAVIVALINTGLDMFMGIIIGYLLGWPIIDTVFLAGVFAMGSAAITGKSLLEMQRMSAPETEFLLGILVVEDFVSMVIMTIAGGLIFKTSAIDPLSMTQLIVGIIAFYMFFIFLAIFAIPRSVKYLEKIKNDELFVLFVLGLLLLSASIAEVAGVPAIIGAFFLGMIFAESKISKRLEERVSPFKDAFVAVFFVSFGMMIDPGMFSTVLPIVLMAVPLVILSDLLLTGALAYFLGFSSKGAAFMGSSMCGRGAESVMFATIGTNSVGVTKAAVINPFAGAFCLIMSVMTPVLMRVSDRTAKMFGKILPSYVKIAASLVNRTVGKIMLPSSLKLFQRTRRTEIALISFFILLIALMVTNGPVQLVVLFAVLLMTSYIYTLAEMEFRVIAKTCNYDNLGITCRDPRHISRFISSFITITLATIVLVTYTFTLLWWSSLVVLLFYMLAVLVLMHRTSAKVRSPSTNLLDLDERKGRNKAARGGRKTKKAERSKAALGTIASKAHRKDVPRPPMDDSNFSSSSQTDPYSWPEGEKGVNDEDTKEKEKWGRL
ncbi:MAG: cation:proton antiporter [Methanomassiliicoccales archaeon]|jgi:CPA2 family monovalent cation:H+ antiporter-2